MTPEDRVFFLKRLYKQKIDEKNAMRADQTKSGRGYSRPRQIG